MKTYIKTAHEEEYNDGKSRTIGILLNTDGNNERVDSLVYIFHDGMYIFFNTIMDMNTYQLYGKFSKVERAYITETDFDTYYDSPFINEKFADHLEWDTWEES